MSSDFEIEQDDELLMHSLATLPKNCKKYWRKRYSLFSKFDDGIFLTSELWYSVTPELTARVIAKIVKKLVPHCRTVLDVCCGGGGNTIQFAELFPTVFAVDINSNNIKCAMHNSVVYGVSEKTTFIEGDWNEIANNEAWASERVPGGRFDFSFCSPPWGGPNYKHLECFDLASMEPFNLRSLCLSMQRVSDNYGLFLPRNSDFDQIRSVTKELYGDKFKTRVICIWQNGSPLGILAIFGPSCTKDI